MKKVIYWLPAAIWMVVIWGFSAQPTLRVSDVNWQDFVIRKTAHVVEYFILHLLYSYALLKSSRLSAYKIALIALLFAIVYAITDELHQTAVYGRQGRIRDVIFDTVGALLGYTIRRRW